jgi:hypothetical protein
LWQRIEVSHGQLKAVVDRLCVSHPPEPDIHWAINTDDCRRDVGYVLADDTVDLRGILAALEIHDATYVRLRAKK